MSHRFVFGLAVVLLVQASFVAAEGLNEEQLTTLSRNLFNRADADKNGQLNDREPAQAQALVMAQIELVARRALNDPSLRIGQIVNEATLPAIPQSDNLTEADFRQHVASMFLAADRPVRALYEQRLDRLFQLQAEMNRRPEQRDGGFPYQDGRNFNDGRFNDGRFNDGRGREGEARGQDGPVNREQERRGQNMEQQRREAAARAAAAQREMQARAEQQRREQQAKAQAAQSQPQPFRNKLQPGQNNPSPFRNKIGGK